VEFVAEVEDIQMVGVGESSRVMCTQKLFIILGEYNKSRREYEFENRREVKASVVVEQKW
jgi:hypothetical protein